MRKRLLGVVASCALVGWSFLPADPIRRSKDVDQVPSEHVKLVVHYDEEGKIAYVECPETMRFERDGRTYTMRPVWRSR